ncbi:MAG: VOC family protein, partial [Bacteroidetes bacterium]|nr:VOC family protein [Bacteroidota bacterium]
MQKVTPCLWFNNNAEEAIDFYAGIFKDVKIIDVLRNGEGGPGPRGSILVAIFTLEGQEYMALNGGPQFPFTEAFSLSVDCDSQAEVDEKWEKLSAGGEKSQCGWLKDRFGLSWQIVPSILPKLLRDKDPVKAGRVMQ